MLLAFLIRLALGLEVARIPQSGTPPQPRYQAKAVPCPEGLIIFGGSDFLEQFDDMWKFNFEAEIWEEVYYSTSEVPESRDEHLFFYLRDKYYLVGGKTLNGIAGDMWKFDLDTRSWSKFQDLVPRLGATFAQTEDKAWIFGGYTDRGYSNSLFEFDGTTWKELNTTGNTPSGREGAKMVYWNNKLVVWGGIEEKGYSDTTLHFYDLTTGVWSELRTSETPPARSYYELYVHGNYLYLLFGFLRSENSDLGDIWQINLESPQKWEFLKNSSFPRDGFAVLKDSSWAYLVGGFAENKHTNQVLKMDLETLNFTEVTSHFEYPSPRKHHTMTTIDTGIWLFGGESSN